MPAAKRYPIRATVQFSERQWDEICEFALRHTLAPAAVIREAASAGLGRLELGIKQRLVDVGEHAHVRRRAQRQGEGEAQGNPAG